jgi:small GTP-binding protein
MIQKKICMLGAFAVGKSSLVQRYVNSTFSERYTATVGVRIHKKEVSLGEAELKLIIWDLAGEDELVRLRTPYLRGSAGYILVVDGTRPETLDKAVDLNERVIAAVGPLPFLVVLNKKDRADDWAIEGRALEGLRRRTWAWIETSARTGEGVDVAFRMIAERLVNGEFAGSAS